MIRSRVYFSTDSSRSIHHLILGWSWSFYQRLGTKTPSTYIIPNQKKSSHEGSNPQKIPDFFLKRSHPVGQCQVLNGQPSHEKTTYIMFKRHHTLNKNPQKLRVVEPKPKPNPKNPTESGKRSVYVKVVVLPWLYEIVRRRVHVDLWQEKIVSSPWFSNGIMVMILYLGLPPKNWWKQQRGDWCDSRKTFKIFTMHIYIYTCLHTVRG